MNRQMEKLVNSNIAVTIPIRLKYDGRKTVIIQPEKSDAELSEESMSPLQKALVQGFQYRDALQSGEVSSVSELARKEGQERAMACGVISGALSSIERRQVWM